MSKRHIVLGLALLIMITTAPAWSTYIPTYSDGKYKGCTYYDDNGEPVTTYLKVSLLNCVIAGIINTPVRSLAVPAAEVPAPIEKQALASLPIDDPAQLAKELESARRNLEEAATEARRAAADLARINGQTKKMKSEVLRQRLLDLRQAQAGAGQ